MASLVKVQEINVGISNAAIEVSAYLNSNQVFSTEEL